MGEDTTELSGLCAEHPGCNGQHPLAAPEHALLGAQDVDDALALLDAVEAGRQPAPRCYASLLQESAVAPEDAGALPPHALAPQVAEAGALLRESARGLGEPEPRGLLEADEVDAALSGLGDGLLGDGLGSELGSGLDGRRGSARGRGRSPEPAWAQAAPSWSSQRPERLHAGAIGAQVQRTAAGSADVGGAGDADDALDPLDTWYVAPAGTPQGPLTLEVLRQRWEAGEVGPDTPCWSGGMARWVPLARVLRLAGALAPPVPRLSLEQVASSLRAPATPPPPAFQPVASGALRSLLAEEQDRARDEARARAESLARLQEARAAALVTYVPPPSPVLEAPATTSRGASVAAALLGGAMTALILTCAGLGFALLRSGEGAAPSNAQAAASAPASAAQAGGALVPATQAGVARVGGAPGTGTQSAALQASAAPGTAARPAAAPGAAKPGASAAPATSRAAEGKRPTAADATPESARPTGAAPVKTAARAAAEVAPAKGEVAFEEDAEDTEPAAAAAAPLGPDEEFERALSAEEPPLAKDAESSDESSEEGAAKPAAPEPAAATTYVPPAPGAGAEVRESLAQADVLETVLAHKAQVRACVDAQRALQPALAGKLVVRFNVLPSGTTADVATETEELQGTPLAGCIEAAVRGWSFPVHRVQGPEIRFPFTL